MEEQKRWSKKTKTIVWTIGIISAIAIFAFAGLLYNIGHAMVVEDTFEQADYIVVLMGSLLDRTLHATDLYHQGKGKQIIVVREHMVGKEYIEARQISVSTNADHAKQIALDLGIPSEAFLVLDGNSDSTQDEARVIREFLSEHTMDKSDKADGLSIVIVTSKYHSFRAKKIFTKALPNITVYSSPSAYDSFEPSHWWKSRSDTRSVIFESLKLLHYYFREQFQM